MTERERHGGRRRGGAWRGPVAAALVALAALAAFPLPASAGVLAITGPTQMTFPTQCAGPVRYAVTGAVGTVSWRLENAPYNVEIDQTGALQYSDPYNGYNPSIVTATDSAGNAGQLAIEYDVLPLGYATPPFKDYVCGFGQHRYAFQVGDVYSITVYQEPVAGQPVVAEEQLEADGTWVECSCDFPRIQMKVPAREIQDIGQQPVDPEGLKVPHVTQTALFDPAVPSAHIIADEPSVFPFPTPDRLIADGANFVDPDGVYFNSQPLGIDYGSSPDPSDFHSLNAMLWESRQPEGIEMDCSGAGYAWTGHYSYCLAADNASYCYGNPPGLSDCLIWPPPGYERLGDGVKGPTSTYDVHDAWTVTSSGDTGGSKVSGAPTPAQEAAITRYYLSHGIDLSSYPSISVQLGDYGGGVYMLDGRATFWCDSHEWQTNILVIQAFYMLDGIYCGGQVTRLDPNPPPDDPVVVDPTGSVVVPVVPPVTPPVVDPPAFPPPVPPVPQRSCGAGTAPTLPRALMP